MALAIEIAGIQKRFALRHTRSLKETVLWLLKGRKGDLSKTFAALNDVSLTVEEGETVALLGFNGSGKSTLLKHISGVMLPDTGTVRTRGRVAGLIEVGAGFHPDLSGRDNVFLNGAILGMSEKDIHRQFDSIVDFAEIGEFIDTEVRFYSSGMYLRLAFSVAVHTDPNVFLIDEILAVGDEPFQRKCISKIKELAEAGKTLVVVSHDLELIGQICRRGVVLEKGRIVHDAPVAEAIAHIRGQ
ncbi:ABC-2 type transport system ATP-binding protein [Arthrobacter subterraneus]|uniref:ABC-2 type transport system ATP-binding protein n=1 Tax=Arthrobacter subterraneus TaxID=335973 RepID=A0A1G8BP33_9MICC|nr:ABC transporter ATP-binding protein [Arthrobacter subterraneus]SDH34985.1 ABC-2 type transport system ATP-binding protein [Arthrobacter subterraneus]